MVNAVVSNGMFIGEGSHGVVDISKNGQLTKTMLKTGYSEEYTFPVVINDIVKVEVHDLDTLYYSEINGIKSTSLEKVITDSLLDTHFNVTYSRNMLIIGIGVIAVLGIGYLALRKKK